MLDDLVAVIDALVSFAQEHVDTPLDQKGFERLQELDASLYALSQITSIVIPQVRTRSDSFPPFGHSQLPTYTSRPCRLVRDESGVTKSEIGEWGRKTYPTEAWFQAMRGMRTTAMLQRQARPTENAVAWDQDPVRVFEQFRDLVGDAIGLASAIHRAALLAPDDAVFSDVGEEHHEELHGAVFRAQGIWRETPVARYLDRSDGPVFLDRLDSNKVERISGSCNHDLALGTAAALWQWIERSLPVREYTDTMRFLSAAGDFVSDRLMGLVPLVRCECQQGIAKWKAEQSTPRREPIAEATDPSTLPMIIVASDVPDLGVANTVPELWDWCNENRERLRRLRGRLGEPAPASVATDEFRIVPEIVRQCRGYLLGFGTKDIPDRFAFANLPQDQTPTGPEHFPSPMEGFLAWASACRAPQHGIIKLVGEVEDFLTWSMAWVKERSEGRPASTEARRGASAMDTSRTQVFVSYSHKDKDRLEEFKLTLKPAISPDMLWDDTKIKAGAKWREEIRQALARARIAVLLVSSHFLASDFIANHELPPLLDEAERGGLTIFWVPVSASMYQETAIAAYQAAHDPAQPLDTLGKPKRNNAWVAICKKLMAARDEAS